MWRWPAFVLLACRSTAPVDAVAPTASDELASKAPPTPAKPSGRVVDVTVGVGATCFALDTGAVHCHGLLPPARGEAVPGFEDIVDVEIGGAEPALCGVRRDGRIVCAAIGFDLERRGEPIPGIDGATALAGRVHGFCAIEGGGSVLCWGSGHPLGKAGDERVVTPTVVRGIEPAQRLETASYEGICAVSEGARSCWGRGPGRSGAAFGPQLVKTFGGAREVDGASSTAVIRGDGTLTFSDPPPDVSAATPIGAVPALASFAVAGFHGCGIAENGEVWCLPKPSDKHRHVRLANKYGQLGAGHTHPEPRPVKTSVEGATQVVATTMHTCARTRDGELFCWGQNELGELGPRPFVTTTPVKVDLPEPVTAIRARGAATCALLANGTLSCWGGDSPGDRFDARVPAPVDVPPADRFGFDYVICGAAGSRGWCNLGGDYLGTFDASGTTDLTVGFSMVCGLRAGGRVVCWQPRQGEEAKPTFLEGVRAKRLFSAASTVIVATKAGTLLELPEADQVDGGSLRASPSALPAGAELVAGSYTLRCVHRASRTTCFDGDMEPEHDFEGLAFTRIAVGIAQACGITPERDVICWGRSRMGQLGTFAMNVPPTKLEGITDVVDVALGPEHVCVLDADGGVRCLGGESNGELGRGFKPDYLSTPTLLYAPPG